MYRCIKKMLLLEYIDCCCAFNVKTAHPQLDLMFVLFIYCLIYFIV